MGWIARALLPEFPAARIASIVLIAWAIPIHAFAGDDWEVNPDSQQIVFGLRIGSSSGPAGYSYPEGRILQRRLGLIGAQITLQQGNVGQIGAGMDVMFGPQYPYREDALSYDLEIVRYGAVFLFVSPGIQIRIGNDQPLSLGASVDLGPLWSRETTSDSGGDYLFVERILAIRPKILLSYNLTHSLRFQFEYGWMHGTIRPEYYFDFDRNWYVEYPRDYNGAYFGTSIAITRPIKRQGIKVFE